MAKRLRKAKRPLAQRKLSKVFNKINESYKHKLKHINEHFSGDEHTETREHLKKIVESHFEAQNDRYSDVVNAYKDILSEKSGVILSKSERKQIFQKIKNLNKTLDADQNHFDTAIDEAIEKHQEVNFNEIEIMEEAGEVINTEYHVNPDGSFTYEEEVKIDDDIAKEAETAEDFVEEEIEVEVNETVDSCLVAEATERPEVDHGNLRGSHGDNDLSGLGQFVQDVCAYISGDTTEL
ncbi:MAG: hypothetical protein RLN62_06545 [Rickettsiales bacterium]